MLAAPESGIMDTKLKRSAGPLETSPTPLAYPSVPRSRPMRIIIPYPSFKQDERLIEHPSVACAIPMNGGC